MTTLALRAVRRAVLAVAAGLVFSTLASAQGATTTGTIRGTVLAAEGGNPIQGVTVTATNTASGVRRGGQTDAAGRFQIPFLEPGSYIVRAQFLGYRPIEAEPMRIAIGQVERVDLRLQTAPTTLAAEVVTADVIPLIETTKSGSSVRIGEEQISELPVNGRNFKDLVWTAPGASEARNDGSGGNQNLGGARTGGSNMLMDGANNNESFFAGDARGGDRAPFSYSIEAIKELQVVLAGYDVERGQYTGGTVNAVTKSGSNRVEGAVFGYFRQAELGSLKITGRDFLGVRPIDFKRQQVGMVIGGPIIKDKAHFLFTYDKQTSNEPRPVYVTDATDQSIRRSGIHEDTLDNFLNIAETVYGLNLRGEVGQFAEEVNEHAILAKIDWQINDAHRLTLRDNFTDLKVTADRLTTGNPASVDLISSGGENNDVANSFVATLFSSLPRSITNEFRVQFAYENKPRPSNPTAGLGYPLPQVRINNIRSALSDGSTQLTGVTFGSDDVIHANNLETKTLEIINNIRMPWNNHNFKIGTNILKVDVFNQFWRNYLGTWTYNSMTDFELENPQSFTRTVPAPGRTSLPVADFDVYEVSFYGQDEWQITPKLFLTYGLRYDYSWYPADVAENPLMEERFPYLDVQQQPEDRNNISPRLGFSYDLTGLGTNVLRGGAGVFYGRTPYVLWSNALLNAGGGSRSLTCNQPNVPLPDFAQYNDVANIPTACVGGGVAAAGAQEINVFEKDFQQSYAFKTNLGFDRALTPNWRFTIEGIYSTVRDNYAVQDDNLNTVPYFYAEGGIPIFVPPGTVSLTNGSVSKTNSRRDANFASVYVHRSLASSISWQGILQLEGRTGWGGVTANYTYDNTSDNNSTSCCTTNGIFRDTKVAGNPNNLNDTWGPATYNRRHVIAISPRARLPYGFLVSSVMRFQSGFRWTPRYTFDINGDGESNDRMYIPTRAELNNYLFQGTPQEQATDRSRFESAIEKYECTREARGTIIDRNACVNPWSYLVDIKVSKKFTTLSRQNFEIVADFFNVLNGINSNWGRTVGVAFANEALLQPNSFDQASNKFRYRYNTTYGRLTSTNPFRVTQFNTQLGLRYNF